MKLITPLLVLIILSCGSCGSSGSSGSIEKLWGSRYQYHPRPGDICYMMLRGDKIRGKYLGIGKNHKKRFEAYISETNHKIYLVTTKTEFKQIEHKPSPNGWPSTATVSNDHKLNLIK